MKTAEEYVDLAEAALESGSRRAGDAAARYIAMAAVYAELAKVAPRRRRVRQRPVDRRGGYAAGREVSATAAPLGSFQPRPAPPARA